MIGLMACLSCTQLRAGSVNLEFANGNSSTVTAPGIRITPSEIPELSGSPGWKLTTFTWLSPRRSGGEPTGRGYLLIFDASKFDPADKTYAQVNNETNGLVAASSTYVDGQYAFPDNVILEKGKSYYILNSVPITTDRTPKAPYQYGFSPSVTSNGIERWAGSETAWGSSTSPGAPNFRASFTPAPKPTSTP